jgi:site-specific recombinase XerD
MTHVLNHNLSKADWGALSEDQDRAFAAADRVWRENGKAESTREGYRNWIMHFLRYCRFRDLDPDTELTRASVQRFAREYARARGVVFASTWRNANKALVGWAHVLQSLGVSLPQWQSKEGREAPNQPEVLEEFRRYLEECGLAAATIHSYLGAGSHMLRQMCKCGRDLRRLEIRDIDRLIAKRSRHLAVSTVGTLCNGLRSFLRFLHATGRHKQDLSTALLGILAPASVRPPRALPWNDVRAILRAIDRTTPIGRRDYALLLLMSTYGCGAGEVIGLQLEDIDWHGNRLHLRRPKTHEPIELPLLPEVARALADYLQHGRPQHTATRAVFVKVTFPHQALASSCAIWGRLQHHASAAHVDAEFLGSHALRHSHASRQLELGTPPKIIGDILGHTDPSSTDVYLRGAVARLRQLALPVPK